MKNANPRFGLDDDGNVYDYLTTKTHPPTGTLIDAVGTWDLSLVKSLIEKSQPIEAALTPLRESGYRDKVEKANKDFAASIDEK